MSESIRVSVVAFGDRSHYQMQYRDPVTGKKKTRSTGVENTGRKRERDAAIGAAGKWEAELREGRYQSPSKATWAQFRERYTQESLAGLSDNGAMRAETVLDMVERLTPVDLLVKMTTERLAEFTRKLRTERQVSESTVKSYLGQLRAALRWAHRQGLLVKLPTFEMPKRAKGAKMMKGRPLGTEEFERLLMHTEKVVGKAPAASWEFYLRGLWWSGLRLAESLELYWDRRDRLCVDLEGKRPMIRIPAELEKGNKDRLLPMAPEFAAMLMKIPEADRTGPVFKPVMPRCRTRRSDATRAGKTIAAIGRKAGIKVEERPGKPAKCATAHDLRRSFGSRWATRVMPAVLQQMMRHESISTTMRYYVGIEADETAEAVWQSFSTANGNTSGNKRPSEAPSKRPRESSQPVTV